MKQDPTEDSVIKESMFGHCSFASRDLTKHNCPGMYQRWYHGKVVKEGSRKKVDGIIYIDEYSKCTCLCHIPEADRPKPKRRRSR